MKRNDIIGEVSLGDYRNKALKQKAQSQMGAMFARDPAEREKNLATFNKREKGLNRLKARDEKARKAAADKDMADTIAQLPQLKDEYEQMKAKYKSLGGSNWQYADREQNLTDREREARSMEGPMNNLWRKINAAEKSQKESVAEGSEFGAYYYEKVAQEIFNKREDISSEDEVLNQAYKIVANDQGQKSARYMFNYDEDFPSDLVSAYFYLQKQKQDVTETTGMLKVAKDDEKQTILQNPTTGVQTQIDKKNPNAPRLTQDDKGKLTLTMPQGAQTGGLGDKPQPLVGKEVQVDQMPEMVDLKKLAGFKEDIFIEAAGDKDLGNGFTLTTTEFNGKLVPAVFDAEGNRYWVKNDTGDRRYGVAQFITIHNGKAIGSKPGTMTAAALKQAGWQTTASAPAPAWNQMTPDQQAAFRTKQQADDAAAVQGAQNAQNYWANKSRTPATSNESLDKMLRIAGLK